MGYKVLFITFWYPTADNPVNGTFIREHARAIRAQGHETVILHFNIVYDRKLFSKVEQTETLPEGRIYRFEIRSRYYKWFYHAYPLLKQIALRIYGSLSKERFIPDIIHSNVVFPSGVIGYYLGKRFRIPAVMTEHWSGFKSFCGHPLFGRISRRAVGYHSKILPVSDYLAGIIRNYKPEAGAVRVVPNIVDQNIYTLKPPRQTDNKLVFTAVANWQARKVPAKRPDIIFGALKAFAESSQKKIILNIVGEGSTLRIYQESRD
ncbi:MAG: glycosyltransferase, partial [Bacteroidales bacterium]|nr:glycosyltransferase [Bacteroidales bacterium]